jgi:hypothetical protein
MLNDNILFEIIKEIYFSNANKIYILTMDEMKIDEKATLYNNEIYGYKNLLKIEEFNKIEIEYLKNNLCSHVLQINFTNLTGDIFFPIAHIGTNGYNDNKSNIKNFLVEVHQKLKSIERTVGIFFNFINQKLKVLKLMVNIILKNVGIFF